MVDVRFASLQQWLSFRVPGFKFGKAPNLSGWLFLTVNNFITKQRHFNCSRIDLKQSIDARGVQQKYRVQGSGTFWLK